MQTHIAIHVPAKKTSLAGKELFGWRSILNDTRYSAAFFLRVTLSHHCLQGKVLDSNQAGTTVNKWISLLSGDLCRTIQKQMKPKLPWGDCHSGTKHNQCSDTDGQLTCTNSLDRSQNKSAVRMQGVCKADFFLQIMNYLEQLLISLLIWSSIKSELFVYTNFLPKTWVCTTATQVLTF